MTARQANGEALPSGTEEEKAALLDAYLDLVIETGEVGEGHSSEANVEEEPRERSS